MLCGPYVARKGCASTLYMYFACLHARLEIAVLVLIILTVEVFNVRHYDCRLVAWRSGNALCRINKVTLRRARLVLGWVTVYGQVNHLGTKPAS